MNVTMRRGRFLARVARTPTDLAAAQRLRHLCFVAGAGLPHRPDGRDRDAHDASCTHVLVEEVATGQAMGCFRLMLFTSGAGVDRSYAAQFYDLSRLSRFPAPWPRSGAFASTPASATVMCCASPGGRSRASSMRRASGCFLAAVPLRAPIPPPMVRPLPHSGRTTLPPPPGHPASARLKS